MQTGNEKQPNAVENCNLDCSPKACGRCTCRPAPHTTCDKHREEGLAFDEAMEEDDGSRMSIDDFLAGKDFEY